jgi:hypothetical protein
MLEGVKSTTSEAASARARVARVREKVEASIDERRILQKERGERRETEETWFIAYLTTKGRIPKLDDVAH